MNRILLAGLLGALIGVLALAAFRLAFVPPGQAVHHHANFAVFVEGERLDLSGNEFMAELAACGLPHEELLPLERVHLHDNVPDVAHVHHEGVTWGHLFANLEMGLGDGYLVTRDGRIHANGEGGTLKFILNGSPEPSVHNKLIRSEDLLLISYGPESIDGIVRDQLPEVPANAHVYNEVPDPEGCAGPDEPTFGERLRHAFIG